jgi:hypothetical protein
MTELSTPAQKLLRHLNDNVWTTRSHAIELGYDAEIKELVGAGLITEQMLAGTPIIVINEKTS